MRLIDLISAPWAILPDRYHQIIEIYNAHVRGPKIDLAALEARLGRPLSPIRREYAGQVVSGVAVLDVEGPLAKRMSTVNAVCEGTSTNRVADFFSQALADPEVKAIVLNIDSPGGAVDGTMDLARAIHAARGKKPIVALADGMACSAAYWIGAAADRFYLANATTLVGSIGVVATHVDQSRALDKAGITVSEVTAGKFKRVTSSLQPLSEDGRAFLQEMVDDICTFFVNDISNFRNVPVEQVLERMAEGRVLMGGKAIEAGLADGVSSLDQLIAELSRSTPSRRPGAGAASTLPQPNSTEAIMPITREELAEQSPDLLTALLDEGKALGAAEAAAAMDGKLAEAKTEGFNQGAEAERARIKGVFEASEGLDGHEALTKELAFDGSTTPDQAAVKVLKAEKELAPLRNRAQQARVVPFGGDPSGSSEDPQNALKARWDANPALHNLYGTFDAFQKAEEAAAAAASRGRIVQKGK